jgi:hypothetical protein
VDGESQQTGAVRIRAQLPDRYRECGIQQPRHRREHIGELVQIDGSAHRWFEDRAAACTLLVFVDDATSRLMELRFVPSESTFAYFEALKAYLRRHGKPVAFSSDKHSIFRVSNENAVQNPHLFGGKVVI